METSNSSLLCANCGMAMEHDDKFCKACGQKKYKGKVSFGELVHDFIHSTLHLDSKFFNTLKYVAIPGKLTEEFFKGKHKSYASPVQLFLVTGTLCFLIFKNYSHEADEKLMHSQQETLKKTRYNEVLADVDSIANALQVKDTATELNSIKKLVAGLHKKYDKFNGESNIKAKDTLLNGAVKYDFGMNDATILSDSSSFFNTKYLQKDLLNLSHEDFIKKYKIEDTWLKFMFKQYQKITISGGSIFTYVVSKLFFGVIFIILIMAALMKLIYIRSGRYYMEHLIFLIHTHTLYFLTFPILFLLNKYINAGLELQILLLIFYLIAMKKYYKQSWSKTILKFTIIFLLYCVVSTTILIITAMIGAALF
jgi:hypothetical protein